jgi:hypothetical protein
MDFLSQIPKDNQILPQTHINAALPSLKDPKYDNITVINNFRMLKPIDSRHDFIHDFSYVF